MNPDIVYIYAHNCSMWRGQEIKYSLRSLEKFGINYGNVVIVGDKPSYFNGKIIHIPKGNEGAFKEKRIYEKLLLACNSDLVSNPFVFFNDDFFLTKKIDFAKLSYCYFDNLGNKILNRKNEDTYKRSLKNTRDALFQKGLTERHFDIHYPMLYYKDKFIRVMSKYDWNIRAGYVLKSLYANTLKIAGKSRKDAKIYMMFDRKKIREIINGTDLFSTDAITRPLGEIIHELYQDKSSYEI